MACTARKGSSEADTLAVGRLVGWGRVIPQGNERYVTDWGQSFLEYELPAATGPASGPPPRFLFVPGTLPGNVGRGLVVGGRRLARDPRV